MLPRSSTWPLPSALLLLAARDAAATVVHTEYERRYGPVNVIALKATTELLATRYRTTLDMRTVGVVGYFFPWHVSATSEGDQTPEGLRPRSHRSSGEYRG